jgi:hypothetical protein
MKARRLMMNYQTYKDQVSARIEQRKLKSKNLYSDKGNSNMGLKVESVCADDEDDKDQLFEFITKMNEYRNKNIWVV